MYSSKNEDYQYLFRLLLPNFSFIRYSSFAYVSRTTSTIAFGGGSVRQTSTSSPKKPSPITTNTQSLFRGHISATATYTSLQNQVIMPWFRLTCIFRMSPAFIFAVDGIMAPRLMTYPQELRQIILGSLNAVLQIASLTLRPQTPNISPLLFKLCIIMRILDMPGARGCSVTLLLQSFTSSRFLKIFLFIQCNFLFTCSSEGSGMKLSGLTFTYRRIYSFSLRILIKSYFRIQLQIFEIYSFNCFYEVSCVQLSVWLFLCIVFSMISIDNLMFSIDYSALFPYSLTIASTYFSLSSWSAIRLVFWVVAQCSSYTTSPIFFSFGPKALQPTFKAATSCYKLPFSTVFPLLPLNEALIKAILESQSGSTTGLRANLTSELI